MDKKAVRKQTNKIYTAEEYLDIKFKDFTCKTPLQNVTMKLIDFKKEILDAYYTGKQAGLSGTQ